MASLSQLVSLSADPRLPIKDRHRAFGEIVARFQDMAYACAYAVLGDFHLSQDAAQEAFIAAWENLPQLRDPVAFPGWFRRIVLARCSRLTRGKRLQTVALEAALDLPASGCDPQAAVETRETQEAVRAAIRSLPERDRMVTMLFYIQGYSYSEIAAFLESPVSTVKKRLHDARRRLKERMVAMVEERLEQERPSRDGTFVKKVIDLIQPRTLEGSDIWEMVSAAIAGDASKIRELLARDPALASCEYWYTQPIHFAVREGHVEAARALLAAGADPAYRSLYGNDSLLTIALDRGHKGVAQLLEESLEERFRSSGKDLEIHQAVSDGDLERVKSLTVSEKSLVHIGDSGGRTPLHRAVEAGRLDIVSFLLDSGAEIDAASGQGGGYGTFGFKPIDLAIWRNTWSRRGNFLLAGYLLARGAAYTITIAAAAGDLERVRLLLDANPASANESQPSGKRPLSAAAEHGHREIVRLLLERGANPNLPESRACPQGFALYAASQRGDLETAKLLLEYGADPNAGVDSSGTPTYIAKGDMRALMYRYGGRQDLWSHVFDGHMDTVAAMLDADPDLWKKDDQGTPFTAAVTNGDRDMFHLLLARGVRVPDTVTGCQTYLWDHPEMTRGLLENGMDPSLPNWQRMTPLHHLASGIGTHGKPRTDTPPLDIARLFLEFGADIDARDEEYRSTPLGWAARCGNLEMAEFLLGQGAKTSLPDDEPWSTPLAWAEKRGHAEIAELLRQRGAEGC
ncbi:MAG: sigma-70 family RNA polymerase sigma factor [Armatimonadetes bacterium]|nr:sigma-70 family RNA polymerase sigma factor [Armatimonadota bacterium]